jgi:hypothetical protein
MLAGPEAPSLALRLHTSFYAPASRSLLVYEYHYLPSHCRILILSGSRVPTREQTVLHV